MSGATLHGIFTASARRAPARTAVEDDTSSVSYGDLNARANRLAHGLIARGVKPETTVAICLERSIDLVVGILGILKAGGAYVPLDASYPPERLQYMVSDSAAHLIVTRTSLQPLFRGQESRLILIDDATLDEPSHLSVDPPDVARAEHLAYIIYTSGSTGLPKGVLVEHGQVVNSLRALEAAFPTGPDAAYLFKSNHTFDASLLEMFGPMWHGGRVVILRPGGERDPLTVLDAVTRHSVTHLFFVTSMMEALLGMCSPSRLEALRSLQHLLVGGEAMSARLAARLRSLGGTVRVANVYGPTETAIICAAFPLDREIEGRTAPIGTMLGDLGGLVLDPLGRAVAAGDVGELYIGGASVARGYLNAPDFTAQRFVADPRGHGRLYRTGDLCRVTADGYLEYVDRVDRQIKIRGYRVELGEIETHLMSHPDICAAVVTATGSSGDLRLSAYYVASDTSLTVPPLALGRHLRRFLPDHMVPVAWLQMPALPVNENGKVDRKALPAIDPERSTTPADRPSTVAEIIADTWAAELGTRAIAPDDDFFALGGHSLSAARVAIALSAALGREVAVSDLYKAPTIATLERTLAISPSVDATASGDGRTATAQRLAAPGCLSYDQVGFWVLDKLKLPFLNVIARRRVKGEIDASSLAAALERVVAKHPALRRRMGRWVPRQHVVDHCPVHLVERDFSAMDQTDAERAALASMDELARRSEWRAGDALVEVRLVKVTPNFSEVQISMPHIVSDEASAIILLDDLSRQYVDIVRREPHSAIERHDGFETFIRDERAAVRDTLRASADFWERYLEDASPIFFPESEVLSPDTRAESVYIELPQTFLEQLRQAGRLHGLGIAELLYAASLRAVARVAEPFPAGAARPLLHAPRSARDRAAYDGAIGLFARIDFLKVVMEGARDLVTLARRVRDADLETAAHQRCPTMMKSAALQKRRWQSRDWLCRAAARAATALLRGADLDFEVALAQTRLAAMQMTPARDFAVAANVLNSFVGEPRRALFGLPIAHAPVHPTYDPPWRRVLELYFLREGGGYQLMVNGDLRSAFRETLGKAVIHEIESLHVAA